jgi:hypothetical protein
MVWRVSIPPLRPLHEHASLNRVKLEQFSRMETQALIESLKPGQPGSLKAKPDGTLTEH